MIEKKIFTEIPGGRDKFHSAILTSFVFNFHHFEFQTLKSLRTKWITNVAVLVDQQRLDEVMGCASGNLRHISKTYSVNGVKAKGAFHPKINFLAGDERLLMVFGSGNITPGGHGKNHELFTGFYADKNNPEQIPLLSEAWEYIIYLAKHLKGFSHERIHKYIPENCTLLKKNAFDKHQFIDLDDNISVALLYNSKESWIFSQLTEKIRKDEITRISIISPYYDEDGELLVELSDHFEKAKLDVYLPEKFGLPPVSIPEKNNIRFWAWENTERGKKELKNQGQYIRKLHSKIFVFEGKSYNYLLLGSANATIPGMGSLVKKPLNEEFGALYRTKNMDWLSQLGLKGNHKRVNIKDYKRSFAVKEMPVERDIERKSNLINITAADLNGCSLTVFFKSFFSPKDHVLSLFSDFGILLKSIKIDHVSPEKRLTVELEAEIVNQNPLYVLIENQQKASLSNKQAINYTDKLINTLPTHENRKFQEIINAFELNQLNGFKILDYLNNLESSETLHIDSKLSASSGRTEREEHIKFDISQVSYIDAINAQENNQKRLNSINSYYSVRLWDRLIRVFKDKIQETQNVLMDEEEEANAERSRERNQPKTAEKKQDIEVNKILSKSEKLKESYIKSLQQICLLNEYNPGIIDFSKFLLITHVITAFAFYENYKFKDEDELAARKKLKNAWKGNIFSILKSFSKILVKHKVVDKEENNFLIAKKEKYKKEALFRFLLYGLIIRDMCTSLEITIEEEVELCIFNLFYYLGLPNASFEKFVEDVFLFEEGLISSPARISKGKEELVNKFREEVPGGDFFFQSHSGICQKMDESGKDLKYKSIFGVNTTSRKKHL